MNRITNAVERMKAQVASKNLTSHIRLSALKRNARRQVPNNQMKGQKMQIDELSHAKSNDAHCLDCGFEMVGGRYVGLCPKCGSDRWYQTRLNQMKITEVRKAFDALRWAFDSSMINWADRLLQQCKEEERGHRGVLPDFARCHTADTIGITDAAKLLSVKRVAEYLTGYPLPPVTDYLHTQKSAYMAAAMAHEYANTIRKEWTAFDLRELAMLSYTDFVKVQESEAA